MLSVSNIIDLMPCELHDKLHRDWEIKLNAEISAYDGYRGSLKAAMFQRSLATQTELRLRRSGRITSEIATSARAKGKSHEM